MASLRRQYETDDTPGLRMRARPSFYIPPLHTILVQDDVQRYFLNIQAEVEAGLPNAAAAEMLHEYYHEVGLINRPDKYDFFNYHFVHNVGIVLPFLFGNPAQPPVILDLGCGMGTQSILFALLGARVVGVDMDPKALSVARDRAARFAEDAGRALDIQFVQGDALSIEYECSGPFDAAYSLFAFNMIQPTTRLLDKLAPVIRVGGYLIIQDGNPRMWFNRLFRPRASLSVGQLRQALTCRGFEIERQAGLYALPPIMWMWSNTGATAADRLLRRYEPLTGSWLHIARRASV